MLTLLDNSTEFALRELFDLAENHRRPLVFWVGAGASAWCGYPLWGELADRMHSDFSRFAASYAKSEGANLIRSGRLPAFFQYCSDVEPHRFNRALTDTLKVRPQTAVHQRFVDAIRAVPGAMVLTTNVDELLDKSLHDATVLLGGDLQRYREIATGRVLGKLHGTIGDLSRTVFRTNDYDALLSQLPLLETLQEIFDRSSVIFVGYSLQDEYVLSRLRNGQAKAVQLGNGPHFAFLSDATRALPENVKAIRYSPEPHKDHRSVISVLEEVRALAGHERADSPTVQAPGLRSAHLLYDVLPPGTWQSSQTINLYDSSGVDKQAIIGAGYTADELAHTNSTAMHDLMVGLLCFDVVHVPVVAVARVHNTIGSAVFWTLSEGGVLRFVSSADADAVVFPSAASISGGSLASCRALNPDKSPKSLQQFLAAQLKPSPGHEEAGARQIAALPSRIDEVDPSRGETIPRMVRTLLLRPTIRRMLGVSEGMSLRSIPRWAVFPILRLANVVRIGIACQDLGISSAKLDFGTGDLAGPVFSAVAGAEWVDSMAGFVISGHFAADIGAAALQDPQLLDAVIRFRDTADGVRLRSEILQGLTALAGGDVTVAINGGLRAALPSKVIQAAQDRFVTMHTPTRGVASPASFWADSRTASGALDRWRRRSRGVLEEKVRELRLSIYDQCPCNSGEKMKFCCWEALHRGS
jgi:hypothetical protein